MKIKTNVKAGLVDFEVKSNSAVKGTGLATGNITFSSSVEGSLKITLTGGQILTFPYPACSKYGCGLPDDTL
jgi:hypothetical protein